MTRFYRTLAAIEGLNKLVNELEHCSEAGIKLRLPPINAIYELITDELSKNMDNYDEYEHNTCVDEMNYMERRIKYYEGKLNGESKKN